MQSEMTIKDFFHLIKKRIIVISVIAAMVMVITAFVTIFLFRPVYEASEHILIGNLQITNAENSYEETQKIPQTLASSVDFIKSSIVLNAVKQELGLQEVSLEEKMMIENNKDSQIITIHVKDQDAELAKKIAKTTAAISIQKMNVFLKLNEVKILEQNEDPIKENNVVSSMTISLIVGVFLGIGLAVILEQLDDSIKNERTVEELIGLSILGKFDGKAKIQKSGKGIPNYKEFYKERRKFSAKEKKNQADRATTIS
ncbi:YveK family protein [Domibacillus aminovorans]|uniref:Polysaccharide chain length determinant N-terminal domain-containing protein n=1 Tax=Domibacillus aminovorans TaxID=29332 RepID=A0A177L2Y8_9BACI|nr:Wzz/FepE/Etk N-terminal domain-containing protein [Domibacillus aminovorans]OAH59742.1 hypothetical protein AWH49_03230 [Domibacillus aminovorans]